MYIYIYLLSYWLNDEEMHLIFQGVAVANYPNQSMVNINRHKIYTSLAYCLHNLGTSNI